MAWDTRLQGDDVKVKVKGGWVTLSGQVRSPPRREAALSDVKRLSGVVGVTNAVELRASPRPEDLKGRIEEALGRQAILQDAPIRVSAQGGEIVLSGVVHSWAERAAARETAWAAPGVVDVIDNLTIVSRSAL